MPNVIAQARDMGNGELIISFVDTAKPQSITYTYPKTQHSITVKNKGQSNITVTINTTPNVIAPGNTFTQEVRFTAFDIIASSGLQMYEVSTKIYTADGVTTTNGLTAERPSGVKIGTMYYDTTLNKPVWWNGTNWKDATGVNA